MASATRHGRTGRRRRQKAARGAPGLALILLAGCAAPLRIDPQHCQEISATLEQQTAAWNEGDLPGFLAAYEEGQAMTFASRGTMVRGHRALQQRYEAAYQGDMGQLTFDDLQYLRLGEDAYLVTGCWALARPPDDPHGVFSLVLRRGPEGFRIVHDHSSGVPVEP